MALSWESPKDEATDAERIRAFGRLADAWSLSVAERATLLSTTPRTYHRWKHDPEIAGLSADQRARVEYLMRIFRNLHAIFDGDDPFADEWIRRPNMHYGERAPLDVLLAGGFAELLEMRGYVGRAAG